MAKTVSDFLVDRIAQWGVTRIFGYPGDGINGVVGALARAGQLIDFIQPRHEEAAAFMACGHAKFTGQVGVCLATSGPGAVHLLTGLYDAKADHQPVVAIVGQKPRPALGGDFQQEIDLPSLFDDVARQYVEMITTPEQARHVVDRAFRIAIATRSPTCIIIPGDVQEMAAKSASHEHATIHSGVGHSEPRVIPNRADLLRAADVLNAGERVAMLVGVGAANAKTEVLEIADKLGAGIAKALLGKPTIPDTLPYVTGGIGFLGTRASYEMMRDCDTLFMVGSGFPYAEFLPEEGSARGVQIDLDARMLSLRYPMEVALVGDSAETLRELIPLVAHKRDRRWRQRIERTVRDWWATLDKRAHNEADPVNPQQFFHALSPRLPDNALLACDTGATVHWYSRHLAMRDGMHAAHSGNLASMGAAMPYALAAKLAYPDRPVIAMIGDGAMQMNGINELITVAKYRSRFIDPHFIVIVLNNRDLNMVSWEQRVLEGDPKFPASQDLPDFPYARFAELAGFVGMRIDSPAKIEPMLDAAFATYAPVLIDVVSDPNVPPLPPHITMKQARNYLRAVARGDVDATKIARASLKEIFS